MRIILQYASISRNFFERILSAKCEKTKRSRQTRHYKKKLQKKNTSNSEDESVPKYLKFFLSVTVAQSVARPTWNLAIRVRTPRGHKLFVLTAPPGILEIAGTKI